MVPVKNEISNLPDLLRSLKEQDTTDFDCVFVDNGSIDGSADFLVMEGLKVVPSGGTLSDARIAGMQSVDTRLVAFIDADHVLSANTVSTIIKAFEAGTRDAFIIPERSLVVNSLYRRVANAERIISEASGRALPRAFRVSAYRERGGHEVGVLFGEDATIADKFREDEIGILSSTVIFHKELGTFSQMALKYFAYGRNASDLHYVAHAVRNNFARLCVATLFYSMRHPFIGAAVALTKLVKYGALTIGRLSKQKARNQPTLLSIAYVSDQAGPTYLGGYESRLWEFARRMATCGHDVHLFTSDDSEHVREGVKVFPVVPKVEYFRPTGFRNLATNVCFSIALLRLLLKPLRFDILDANSTPFVHLPVCALLARRWRAKLVITVHEALGKEIAPYFNKKNVPAPKLQARLAVWVYKRTQELANVIISTSPSCVEALRAEGYRCAIFSVPAGQDRVEEPELQDANGGPLSAVFVGRHAPNKRIEIAIDAVRKCEHVRLTILGDGPVRDQLEARAKDCPNIDFVGRVSEHEKRRLLCKAHVLVLPSYREGWSLAAAEAMAHGVLPIYAYRRGEAETGVRFYSTPGLDAIQFDGSATHLRETLIWLSDNRDVLDRMRRAAYARAEAFSWRERLRDLVAAYRAAMR